MEVEAPIAPTLFTEVEIVPKRSRRGGGHRRKRNNRGVNWNALGNEVWTRIISNLDGLSLYAMLFLSQRFEKLVAGSNTAWTQAGFACLPHAWSILSAPGMLYTTYSLEARLFLKYAILYERFSAQALMSQNFRPYCLKCTGVSLPSLAKLLPSHDQRFSAAYHIPPSEWRSPTSPETARQAETSPSSTKSSVSPSNTILAPSPEPQTMPVAIEHQENAPIADETGEQAQNDENTAGEGGELEDPTDLQVAIADGSSFSFKPHGSLLKSLSKLKNMMDRMRKTPKTVPSPAPVSKSPGPASSGSKRRHLAFDDNLAQEVTHYGVDEAWFRLADPKNLVVPGFAFGDWRVKSEVQHLVDLVSAFHLNPRVVSIGAYIVRRLCYLDSATDSSIVSSIRTRLSSTGVEEMLLETLEVFKKDAAVVASILVALGNLALANVSACFIGEHGLSLIVRVMKRHRDSPKIIENAIFLLLSVCDKRIEYKKKLKNLDLPQFIVKSLNKFVASIRQSDKPSAASSKSSKKNEPKPAEALNASLSSSILSYSSSTSPKTSSVLSSSSNTHDRSSLVDSQGMNHGGSDRGAHSDSYSSMPELGEAVEVVAAEVSEEASEEEEDILGRTEAPNERTCKWIMKHRVLPTTLHDDWIQQHLSDIMMIRRLLDMLSVLSADYDIVKGDLSLKSATVISEIIVMLFGAPYSCIDSVVTSAFRCLLVIYEWDVHNEVWSNLEMFVHSLLILASSFVKAKIKLPYIANCYLLIFSLVWKKWNLDTERKELVNLILASLRQEVPQPSLDRESAASNESLANGAPKTTPKISPLLIPAAAMLGDMAQTFFSIRTHITDMGGVQLLRSFKEGLEGENLRRLSAALDEFEDNPLIRARNQAARNQADLDADGPVAGP